MTTWYYRFTASTGGATHCSLILFCTMAKYRLNPDSSPDTRIAVTGFATGCGFEATAVFGCGRGACSSCLASSESDGSFSRALVSATGGTGTGRYSPSRGASGGRSMPRRASRSRLSAAFNVTFSLIDGITGTFAAIGALARDAACSGGGGGAASTRRFT